MKIRNKVILSFFICFSGVVVAMNACSPMHTKSLSSDGSSTFNDQAAFQKVQGILETNCNSCHSQNGSTASFQLSSAEEFIRHGLVVPGKPASSKLIYRLRNYVDGENNSNNMPPSQPISDEDYQVLYTWILNLPAEGTPFQCQETSFSLANLESKNAKRLSQLQYKNTLIDFTAMLVGKSAAVSMVNNILSGVTLPTDSGVNFSRENNAFTGNHAQAYFDVADALASQISSNHLQNAVSNGIQISPGNCVNPSVSNLSQVCRTQLIRNLTQFAYRRPLREAGHMLTDTNGMTVDELTPLSQEFSGVATGQALSQLLFRFFMSPHFLFQIEDQDLITIMPGQLNIYQLSSYAIASRLSYRFWNSIPDPHLMGLAVSTNLYEDGPYNVALSYVLSQEDKLKQSLDEYFYDWLHLGDTPRFNVNGRFSLIQGNVNFDSNLRTAMIDEVQDFSSLVVQSGGSFEDLFTANYSVTRDSDLMRIYGVSQAPLPLSVATAPRFPAGEHGGILTRSAMLITGSELTSPILRGAHVRDKILCLTLGTPPADALDQFDSIPVPHIASMREKVGTKTAGPSCVGCHQLINPLGFGFSNFDAFGSFVDQEPIFNNSQDIVDAYVAVDASVDLSNIVGPGVVANNAIELSRQISEQTSARSCFSKKILSYAMNRSVDEAKDSCRLGRVYNTLDKDANLLDMLRSTASDPEFRLRKIEGL